MKKNYKKFLLLPGLFALAGCMDSGYYSVPPDQYYEPSLKEDNYYADTNEYNQIRENRFINTQIEDTSYFSMCSSTAAYTNIKSLIMEQNSRPNTDAVMIEQMLNYFTYDYNLVHGEDLKIFNEVSDCPWNEDHKLASIAVKARDVAEEERKSMNLVFLIDVSGSMDGDLKLVKEAFRTLVNNLSPNDRISIVTYANRVKTVLNGGSLAKKYEILDAIDELYAGGGTNGAGGIQKAYEVAQENFIEGGNNRVILATDGDFNVGISDNNGLERFIKEKRDESNVYLSILGFGMNNYRNDFAETLAKNGDGNMFYVNSQEEINRLFAGDLTASLQVVARDVKTSVTFDKTQIASYRLIGYENSQLTEAEYNNTKTDAGEILAGDVTVVLYELVLRNDANLSKNLFTSEIKYKDPDTKANKVISNKNSICSILQSMNFTFQAMVAEYGLLLRNSYYKGTANYQDILELYDDNKEAFDQDDDKKGFRELVSKTKTEFAYNEQ